MSEPESSARPLPGPDLLGRRIGDYQTLRRLGSGGMADVYLAEQVSLRRKVALKVLKPELVKDSTYVARFIREAQAAAALVQSNIVQIYEVGEKDGTHYIAQEYIPGRNLRQFIARFGAVQAVMAINVLRQAGMALQKAGEQGVTHRDIKPENIMLSPGGEVKVTDFGLARIETGGQRNDLTQVGIAMGTPLYMSPEQIEGRPVDTRSDIYSLGVTAWHMLAGYPPFQGENALALALQHVRTDPAELQKIRPDLPASLCEIVHRMMAKDPAGRYASAADMLRDLRNVQIDLDGELDLLASRLADVRPPSEERGSQVPTQGLEATRQLQVLMKGNDRVRTFWSRTLVATLAVSLIGAGAGASAAFLSPPPDRLAQAGTVSANEIPRESTAERQYAAALWAGTIAHFRAVEQYFPVREAPEGQRNKTQLHNRKAWLQLARLFLAERDFASAQEYFQRLANANDAARYLQLSGKVGLAWLAENIGLDLEARRQMLEMDLKPDDLTDLDDWVRALLDELMGKYGRELPGFEDEAWGQRMRVLVPMMRKLPDGDAH